jgi:cell division protein FtsI (penicillin-binding protein 3)
MTDRPPLPNPADPQQAQHRRTLWVARLCIGLISLAMVGLLARVAQLQLRPAPEVAAVAEGRDTASTLMARRGDLTDRHGRVLAASHVGYRLYVDPQAVRDDDTFSLRLAHAIGDDPVRIDQLMGRSRPESRYLVVSHLITEQQAEAVRELKLPGAGLERRLVREYPAGTLAGQVIGFVNRDHAGADGAELAFTEQLTGADGQAEYLRDARRRAVRLEAGSLQAPRDGQAVALSLDMVIQAIAETQLAAMAAKYKPKAAELIVMHARSGQVLAMVNWPFFDPNIGGNAPAELRRNRCITDAYEPGSIFKPIVFTAITAAGLARPTEKLDCTTSGLYVSPRGRRLRDAHAHGSITWDQVLVLSSNIGMAIGGQRLGTQRMYQSVRAFGMGHPTGCGLIGEAKGIVNPLRQWNHYSETSVPMGQEIAVTPLQMVRAFSAFANEGRMVTPTILARHSDRPMYQVATDPATAAHVKQVLRRVITDGTGRFRANSKLYQMWGKTGTAQVPDRVRGGYIDRAYTASFVCGAPLRNPQIIVAVVVHQPDPKIGYYGGTVAAPVAREVVEQSLGYLCVPPDVIDADRQPTYQLASTLAYD